MKGRDQSLKEKKTVIAVPCFNESSRLDTNEFARFCQNHANVDFIFSDDGSTDGTCGIIRGLCAEFPGRTGQVRMRQNRGKSEAIRRAINTVCFSEADYVGYWDADLATPLNEIPRFLEVLEEYPGVHLVTGARIRLLGRDVEREALRHYAGRAGATLISQCLGVSFYDTQCGAKIFRYNSRTAALFARPFVSGWLFDAEIIARMIIASRTDTGLSPEKSVFELPLMKWSDPGGSSVRIRDYISSLSDLLKIRRILKCQGYSRE